MKYFTACILVLGLGSCVSPQALLAPKELKSIPRDQVSLLSAAKANADAGDMTPAQASAIFAADIKAWKRLDEYYNDVPSDVEAEE